MRSAGKPGAVLAAMIAWMAGSAGCTTAPSKPLSDSMACGNYMCSICCTARAWAMDNDDLLPSDFLSMSNELATPRVLICPGDRSRHPALRWESLTPAQSSYEIVGPGRREGDANAVFIRCKVHPDHLGYADGTVFDGTRRRTKVNLPE